MNKKLKNITFAVWVLTFLWTLYLVLGKQMIWKVATTKNFTTENAGYLILGIFPLVILFFLNRNFGSKIEQVLKKYGRVLLYVTLALLLIWNLFVCYGGYFYSGWDAGMIHDTVFREFYHEYDQLNNEYFSWFPNNKLIVWIFTGVLKLADMLGVQALDYALVAFQVIIGVLSMWLVYAITFDMAHNYRLAWMTYLTAYFFVGLSPWYIVAYSDATSMIIPLLIIRVYQLIRKRKRIILRILLWILLGFIAMSGYYIKPQTVIAFIAVVLVEIFFVLHSISLYKVKIFTIRFVSGLAGMIICSIIYSSMIVPTLHFQINPNTTIGAQHYLMMGLNNPRDGVFHEEDYVFTRSFATNEERNAADMEEVKRRLQEYGAKKLFLHICRKQIVNYNDGTFAWGVEGHSFNGDPEWAQNRASKVIRSYIKPDGANYNKFISVKQIMWITILFFLLFTVFYRKKDISDGAEKLLVLMVLSLLGLTIFELLFEARARYLFCYAPVYVMLAVFGMRNAFRCGNKVILSLRNGK